MIRFRPFFFLGALYELLRISILFIFAVGVITPELDQVIILLFVLLAAPGIVIFAGYLFIGIYTSKYGILTKILAIAKVSAVFPVIIGALNALGFITFSSARYQLESAGLLFGIIILFDLLFFLFLVSYKNREETVMSSPADTAGQPDESRSELPEMEEVDLED